MSGLVSVFIFVFDARSSLGSPGMKSATTRKLLVDPFTIAFHTIVSHIAEVATASCAVDEVLQRVIMIPTNIGILLLSRVKPNKLSCKWLAAFA